jgi:Domain of unknown function (DUF1877)
MGMIGNYRRITKEQLAILQKEPFAITTFLFPGYEVDKTTELDGHYLNIDKTWHALHFLLTGTAFPSQPPLTNVVMGGTPLGDPENPNFDFGPAHFLTPLEVQEVAKAISEISLSELQTRFNPLALIASHVYPTDLWERGQQEVDYVTCYFVPLVKFFQEAAKHGEVVLFYIS